MTSQKLFERYRQVRSLSEALCEPLETEDYIIQSMPDVSPAKWHLAHTSWFFETFLLMADTNYRPFHPQYKYLFNSYYNAVGPQWTRARRGLLSRPTVEEIYRYRRHVDEHMSTMFEKRVVDEMGWLRELTVLGLHHEQQHQELMLMDIKHVFACNPLHPVYRARSDESLPEAGPIHWIASDGGTVEIGHSGDGFAYDNESPRHAVLLHPHRLASRLVTCGEYLAFIDDGGYQRPEFWLSDGWARLQAESWQAPLYWEKHDDGWRIMTLSGLRPVDLNEPVCHVSYFEADAYASWAGARLPKEQEWETAARDLPMVGNFVESGRLHPTAANASSTPDTLGQAFGDLWEWTASPYTAYPGYRPAEGAVGEYNGKFMCNQYVLRGGACVTSQTHVRPTYRNFFPPDARWPFTGIRLAQDA